MSNNSPLAAVRMPGFAIKKVITAMPYPLTPQETEFLNQILPHIGTDRKVRYIKLREAGVPEKTAKIFKSDLDYLDSLVNRRLQKLRGKGWIEMVDSTITILRACGTIFKLGHYPRRPLRLLADILNRRAHSIFTWNSLRLSGM